MTNIKKYVMSYMPLDLSSPPFGMFIGSISLVEVNEDDEECIMDVMPVYIKFRDAICESEQEILQGLIDRICKRAYLDKQVPDNIRVYLHMDAKRYLIEDEYRPELYY